MFDTYIIRHVNSIKSLLYIYLSKPFSLLLCPWRRKVPRHIEINILTNFLYVCSLNACALGLMFCLQDLYYYDTPMSVSKNASHPIHAPLALAKNTRIADLHVMVKICTLDRQYENTSTLNGSYCLNTVSVWM